MEKINNYLIGGKLGDFIHCLLVPSYMYDKTGIRANIYLDITGGWEREIEKTYEDLFGLMFAQEYINDFRIFKGENIDYDLRKFRNSDLLYRSSWTQILLREECVGLWNYNWLKTDKFPNFENIVFINRSDKPWNERLEKEYNNIIDNNECKFLTFDKKQYELFPLKHKIPCETYPTVGGLAYAINSCKQYVGNQSAPSAIAMALGVTRKIELLDLIDRIHYERESLFNSPDKLTFF